jgi:hypothetical protein
MDRETLNRLLGVNPRQSLTRQEAVAPTPQQAIAQTSQTRPLQESSKRQQYMVPGAGGALPEQNTNPVAARHQRRAITAKEASTRGVGFAPVTEWRDDDDGVAAIGGGTTRVKANSSSKANDGEIKKTVKAPQNNSNETIASTDRQVSKTPFDRHQRSQVDETKANTESVDAIQSGLGLTRGNDAMPTRRPGAAVQPAQRRYNNLDDISRSIEELYPVESDADKAKREKLEKSQRIMAGIGDAFSAFKEAYDSARGKQVTPSKGNSRQLEDRLLALENVRKADRKSRIAALERLAQLQYQQDKGDWNVEYQKGQIDKWKQEAIDRKEKNDLQRYKLDIDSKYKDGLLDIKKEELEIKRQESEGKISHWQATERLQELNMRLKESQFRASQQPTTTTTSSTSTNAKGETTTRTTTSVRSKGVGGSTKSSSRSNKKAGGNTQNKKPINGVNWKKKK